MFISPSYYYFIIFCLIPCQILLLFLGNGSTFLLAQYVPLFFTFIITQLLASLWSNRGFLLNAISRHISIVLSSSPIFMHGLLELSQLLRQLLLSWQEKIFYCYYSSDGKIKTLQTFSSLLPIMTFSTKAQCSISGYSLGKSSVLTLLTRY